MGSSLTLSHRAGGGRGGGFIRLSQTNPGRGEIRDLLTPQALGEPTTGHSGAKASQANGSPGGWVGLRASTQGSWA